MQQRLSALFGLLATVFLGQALAAPVAPLVPHDGAHSPVLLIARSELVSSPYADAYAIAKRGWPKKPQRSHPENISSLTGLQTPFEKKPSYYERAKARLHGDRAASTHYSFAENQDGAVVTMRNGRTGEETQKLHPKDSQTYADIRNGNFGGYKGKEKPNW